MEYKFKTLLAKIIAFFVPKPINPKPRPTADFIGQLYVDAGQEKYSNITDGSNYDS